MTPEEIRAQQLARTMQANPSGPPPGPALSPSMSKCPQCGIYHPPVKPGEVCPLKPATVKSPDGTVHQLELDKYLVTMKTIIVSQLGKKQLKDPKKFFQNMIIELTKFIEGYKE